MRRLKNKNLIMLFICGLTGFCILFLRQNEYTEKKKLSVCTRARCLIFTVKIIVHAASTSATFAAAAAALSRVLSRLGCLRVSDMWCLPGESQGHV